MQTIHIKWDDKRGAVTKNGSLSNVGVPFKSSTTNGRECFFLASFFMVVLHETAIESVLGIC